MMIQGNTNPRPPHNGQSPHQKSHLLEKAINAAGVPAMTIKTAVEQLTTGRRRMFQLLDEGEPGQLYSQTTLRLSVSTPTEEQIRALIANTLPVRDAVLSGEFFIIETNSDHSVIRAWTIATFADHDLPQPGLRLRKEKSTP